MGQLCVPSSYQRTLGGLHEMWHVKGVAPCPACSNRSIKRARSCEWHPCLHSCSPGGRLLIPPLYLTVSCPTLDAPADGRKFGSKYLVDHEVHFTCNPGFQLVGPSSMVCLANGTWTGEKPHCRGMAILPHPHYTAWVCWSKRVIPETSDSLFSLCV